MLKIPETAPELRARARYRDAECERALAEYRVLDARHHAKEAELLRDRAEEAEMRSK